MWRAEIVLATADGHGTNEIMRRTGKSKPCVWRWQERYVEAGVGGLLRDKTRPSRVPRLAEDIKLAVLNFIPTSSSWLNLVERFFAEITGKRIRRGTFASVAELEVAIDSYLLRHNASAKPYRWTKPAADILANERRALDKLEDIKSGSQASDSEH